MSPSRRARISTVSIGRRSPVIGVASSTGPRRTVATSPSASAIVGAGRPPPGRAGEAGAGARDLQGDRLPLLHELEVGLPRLRAREVDAPLGAEAVEDRPAQYHPDV